MSKSFFSELKRRNVFKVGTAYVIASWLIIQIVDTVVPHMSVPEWIPGFTIILLMIGLPISLIVAWAFELTPEGLKKTDEVPQEVSIASNTGQRINYVIIGVLVIAVLFFAYDKWFTSTISNSESTSSGTVTEEITDKTIAVLPFVSFSNDDSLGWLADGLTEEILNTLVKTRDLRVSSRTSSFSYKGTNKPVEEIANELGVAHILEGSVRQSGDRTRITAQLIRATDGFHLWSETYDSTSKDIIQIQEDIAIQIATAMQTAMDPEALRNMMNAGTSNVTAYEAYLEALSLSGNNNGIIRAGATKKEVELYEKALALDPNFTSAHYRLVEIYLYEMQLTSGSFLSLGMDLPTTKKLFLETAESALDAINDRTIELYIELLVAQVKLDFIRAREITEIILSDHLDQQFVYLSANRINYTLIVNGERDRLKQFSDDLWALSTHDVNAVVTRIVGNLWSSNPEQAFETIQEMMALFPNSQSAAYQAHRAYLWLGKVEEAKALIPVATSGTPPRHWKNAVLIRQACAEGRVDDAIAISQAMLKEVTGDISDYTVIFQMYILLNRKQEAHDSIRSLDEDGHFFELSNNMFYPYFDVNEFPNLKALLESQGIPIPEYQPLPFACPIES